LGQWNAISRGEQDEYSLTQTLFVGLATGLVQASTALTCFEFEVEVYAKGAWGFGWRPIGMLRKGERVLSRDQNDRYGRLVWKRIEEVFARPAWVRDMVVRGQKLGTTIEHPFHEMHHGWVPVGRLEVGDGLIGINPFLAADFEGFAPGFRS